MLNEHETAVPRWRAAVQSALQEQNPNLLEARARTAQEAIFQRMQDACPGPGFAEEQSLFEALDQLHALRVRRAADR
jgi:hypothetical protein